MAELCNAPDPNVGRGPWCRMCQAEKRADNHWFETEEVVGWQGLEGVAQLVVRPLQLPLAKGRDPICGEACLQKRVAIWAGAHLLPRKVAGQALLSQGAGAQVER